MSYVFVSEFYVMSEDELLFVFEFWRMTTRIVIPFVYR